MYSAIQEWNTYLTELLSITAWGASLSTSITYTSLRYIGNRLSTIYSNLKTKLWNPSLKHSPRRSVHCDKHHSPRQTRRLWVGASHEGDTPPPQVAWPSDQRGTGGGQPLAYWWDVRSRHDKLYRSGWYQSRRRQLQSSNNGTCTRGSQCHAWDTPTGRREEGEVSRRCGTSGPGRLSECYTPLT